MHVVKLLEANDDLYNYLTSRSLDFIQFYTVLCRMSIQSEGRRFLSKNNFIETTIRLNFQLLSNLNHELKRPAIFALCHLTKESVYRSKFKPENESSSQNLIQIPNCKHLLCPSHSCLVSEQSSNIYQTVQTTSTIKPLNISTTSQSGILLITQLVKEECLRTDPTPYEASLLSILHEFYNDNNALVLFKNYDLVKILIEALGINRKIYEENVEEFQMSDWIDTDLIDQRDTLSLDNNYTTQPGSGSIQKQVSNEFRMKFGSNTTNMDYFTDWLEKDSDSKSDSKSESSKSCKSEVSENSSQILSDKSTGSSCFTPPPFKKFKKRKSLKTPDKQTKTEDFPNTIPTDSPLINPLIPKIPRRHTLEFFEKKTQEDTMINSQNYYEKRIDQIVTILEKFTSLPQIFQKSDGTIPYTAPSLMIKSSNHQSLEIFLNFIKNTAKISFVHTRFLQTIIKENPDVNFIAKIHDLIRYRLDNKNEIFNLIYPNSQYGRMIGTKPSETTILEVFDKRFLPKAVEKHGEANLQPLIKVFNPAKLTENDIKEILIKYTKNRTPVYKSAMYHLITMFHKKIQKVLLTEFNSDVTENYLHNLNSQASICYYNPTVSDTYLNRNSKLVRLLAIPNSEQNSRLDNYSPLNLPSPSSSSGGSSPGYISNFTQSQASEGILIERHTLIEKSPFFQAMLRTNNFRESCQEVIDIVQCNNLSLEFIIHVLSGCRNCDIIKSPDINKTNAGEILELANRFLLDESLLIFVEGVLFETFRNSEGKDLVSVWESYRNLQNFPVSYWKKFTMLEALRLTMDRNNWKMEVRFDENLELQALIREFQELLKI